MNKKRMLVLTEGHTEPTAGKTASALVRYCPEEVVAILDSTQAGKDLAELMGAGAGIPIVATLTDALPRRPDSLVIGITPAGGKLPDSWRKIIVQALQNGLTIISGLHTFLNDDPEFSGLAKKFNVSLIDLRKPPENLTVNKCRVKDLTCFRVHTVGTDCNVGKKVVCLELTRAFRQRQLDAQFVATGQTGVLLAGSGIVIDRVPADFIAGAAEQLVLDNAAHDYLFLEGQGALTHPLYSGVTLGMLHGFAPQALILVHEYGREIMRGSKDTPILPPQSVIPLYEMLAAPVFPAKVVGIALNLRRLPNDRALIEIEKTEQATGLPTTDVYKFGTEKLVAAVLEFEKAWRNPGV
jgi:uncharacterized NAD-dependent epimerase/dehydratase family protein